MAQSKRRKPRPAGGFVPRSQRDFGSLEDMQARHSAPAARPATRPSAGPSAATRETFREVVAKPTARHLGRNVAIGAGAAAAAGTTGYLIHRNHQRKNAMSKNLVNPFEEVVAFGKAYKVALPVPGATRIRALVPTGGHVGHGNALTHVRHGSGGGRNATKLEVYRHTPKGQRSGPFGKAAAFSETGATGVQRGLGLIAGMAAPKRVPVAPKTPLRVRVARGKMRNSNIPDGARSGRKL